MPKFPAVQIYPGDWKKDPAVRSCSIAARGLWWEILLSMFECPERGILKTGENPWGLPEIAADAGIPTSQAEHLLAELEKKGVFSRRESDGALMNRRMVRDEEIRSKDRKRKRKEAVSGFIPEEFRRSSSSSSSSLELKSKAIAQNRGSPALPGFDLFWQAYPKHVGKPLARRAWLSKVQDDSKWPEVIAGLEVWKKSEQWQDAQYIPYPATFLNQRRWEDEVPKGGGLAEQNREAAERTAKKHGLERPN